MPVVLLLLACSSSSIYGTTVAGTHTAASGSTSGALSNSSGSSGTSGTAGGATTGSTGGGTASAGSTGTTSGAPLLDCTTQPLTDCPMGQVELVTQIIDETNMMPLNKPVQIENYLNSTVATSGAEGLVHLCFPPGTLVAPEAQVTGYVTMLFSDVQLDQSECISQLPIFGENAWNLVTQNLDTYDPTQSAIVVSVDRAAGNPPAYCTLNGWVFSLEDLDGGPVAAQAAYVSGVSISPYQWTNTSGIAVLYNVDPAIGVVRVIGSQSDAGPRCGRSPQQEYPGTVHLLPTGVISSLEFNITDAGP